MQAAASPLHPLATSFAEVADVYERGRPEYPPAAIGALSAELGLAPGARVLDLAAGTGKLTRALVAAGLDVVAVEPQRALRGQAEAIPLSDQSVDAVTVADAFHWFDQPAALAEIHRVLRPDGGLVVLITLPDWSGASWAREVGELLRSSRPEHPQFEGPPWQQSVRASGAWTEPREVRVTAPQPASPERLRDHVASFSWIAGMAEPQREQMLARVEGLMRAGETPAELPFHVVLGLTAPR